MKNAKLSPHFWLSEFTTSHTATRRGIDNEPPATAMGNLRQLAVLLEAARVLLGGKPLHISSGYRSPLLNHVVGGALHSAHMDGRAADFTCPEYGTPLEICRRLADAGLPYDKMIQEGTWVHIQIPREGKTPRREVYTAVFGFPSTTYVAGLT